MSGAGSQASEEGPAAHRHGRSEGAQMESLRKASELHELREGEPLPEAVKRGAVKIDESKQKSGRAKTKKDVKEKVGKKVGKEKTDKEKAGKEKAGKEKVQEEEGNEEYPESGEDGEEEEEEEE
ncbi:hypothetical protein BC938DRAFT_479751 [Jimgerdemannia flammicorona]|uniref:Uncharacterized protein n=1 Tax=Jimgerdemannia flammicorona TaxID=994334 RepID=A0A433QK75_9FUNG|nr:hypothetical protein BC938DRAFT_479751 [Jimgerdemannia flammicorona]